MSDGKKFEHIKVSAADDDIVIQAGIPDASQQKCEDMLSAKDIQAHGHSPEASDVSDAAESTPSSEAIEGASGKRSHAPSASDDGYHETTLEDIKSSKMSVMQKAIIAIAVVAVIAFAVYTYISGL